ncbi:hypothetical protein D3C87_1514780 [compost metagenome]
MTINTVFIGSATLLTVRLLRYPIRNYADEEQKRFANRWVSIIALITVIPSLYYGYLLVKKENFIQNANNFIANESLIEGDFLLKNELIPQRREIKLTYGGKTISEAEKTRLNKRKAIYGLAETNLIIEQGFSISDVSKDLTQTELYQARINQLKNELSIAIQKQDSLSGQEKIGRALLEEMRPLFPFVSYCSAKRQQFFLLNTKSSAYTVVVIGTKNPRQTRKDLARLTEWMKVRLKTDSLKVFVEKAI